MNDSTEQLLVELGTLVINHVPLDRRKRALEVVAELRRREEEARRMIEEIRTELEGLPR